MRYEHAGRNGDGQLAKVFAGEVKAKLAKMAEGWPFDRAFDAWVKRRLPKFMQGCGPALLADAETRQGCIEAEAKLLLVEGARRLHRRFHDLAKVACLKAGMLLERRAEELTKGADSRRL